MAKTKLADKREISKVSLKQVSTERAGSPFLSRTEKQHIRESELPGGKSKTVSLKQGAVLSVGASIATKSSATLTVTLTDRAFNILRGWLEFDVFVDTPQNDTDSS